MIQLSRHRRRKLRLTAVTFDDLDVHDLRVGVHVRQRVKRRVFFTQVKDVHVRDAEPVVTLTSGAEQAICTDCLTDFRQKLVVGVCTVEVEGGGVFGEVDDSLDVRLRRGALGEALTDHDAVICHGWMRHEGYVGVDAGVISPVYAIAVGLGEDFTFTEGGVIPQILHRLCGCETVAKEVVLGLVVRHIDEVDEELVITRVFDEDEGVGGLSHVTLITRDDGFDYAVVVCANVVDGTSHFPFYSRDDKLRLRMEEWKVTGVMPCCMHHCSR